MPYKQNMDTIGAEGVKAEQFILWLMTGADDLKTLREMYPNKTSSTYLRIYQSNEWIKQHTPLAEPIPGLRKQLEYDCKHDVTNEFWTRSAGMAYALPIPWEYRVTGVKDFRVTALTPLFGQPAKTPLNRFMTIYWFYPRQIISYRTKKLVWGYSDKRNVDDLTQWLRLNPMAPPVMKLKFKTPPSEVPAEVQFVTTLETTDGKTLRDTLRVHLK